MEVLITKYDKNDVSECIVALHRGELTSIQIDLIDKILSEKQFEFEKQERKAIEEKYK